MMLFHTDRETLKSHLRPLSVVVLHLLLTHSCRGQSQLIGSSQPVVATVGDDIILPCRLEPAEDAVAMVLEWTKYDQNPFSVHLWVGGQEVLDNKHPSYKGRTSLSSDELKRGNISLKLCDVRPSDAGRYRCFIPTLNMASFIELVVGAASSPVTSLAGIDSDKGKAVLQCVSAGWYPEPEVLWLDGEGNLLSAGPTETVRGPDDLYTVSSRVTVEKRHSNSFTCRVQQRNINQTRETHIQVPDDVFKVQCSCSPIIIGLAVSLAVCILLIALLSFVVWKWRPNMNKTRRCNCDETGDEERKSCSDTNRDEDQNVTEEERDRLMKHETVLTNGGVTKEKTKHLCECRPCLKCPMTNEDSEGLTNVREHGEHDNIQNLRQEKRRREQAAAVTKGSGDKERQRRTAALPVKAHERELPHGNPKCILSDKYCCKHCTSGHDINMTHIVQ